MAKLTEGHETCLMTSPLSSLLISGLAALLAVSLLSCASGHDNFVNGMQAEVGKDIDNPYLTRNQYPTRRAASRVLPNGNTEEEFHTGWPGCKVFFEIDNQARKIVGWRYEGTKKQ